MKHRVTISAGFATRIECEVLFEEDFAGTGSQISISTYEFNDLEIAFDFYKKCLSKCSKVELQSIN